MELNLEVQASQVNEMTEKETSKMKLCIIMRGLPGAGLSTISKEICEKWPGKKTVISVDDYFKDNKKKYENEDLPEAFKYSFSLFKTAINNNSDLIIVDNSNIREHNYAHFVDYAQRAGYTTLITIVPTNHISNRELAQRNAHGVRELTIKKMRKNFEWKLES